MAAGDDLEPGYLADLQQRLREQPMINASGLVASRESWLGFCREFRQAARGLSCFGTDQFVVNGHLHRVGFERLPATYNLSLKTTRQPFTIRESRFYDQEGRLIVVAHNTGGREPSRAIRSFGYGPGCNRGVRRIRKLATRWHYQLWRLIRR